MRLFVALPVPVDVARACADRLGSLTERHPGARWIPAEHLHLTLVFLGEVPVERVTGIIAILDEVAAEYSPFEVGLAAGAGRARRDGNGVAWLSVGRGGLEATALANTLHVRLAVGDARPPAGDRPHVTVARRASRGLIDELGRLPSGPAIAWRTDRLILFRSHLGPPGARYERIHEAMLGG